MIWPTLRRVFAVAIGFFLAVIAGGLTLFLLGSRWAAGEATAFGPQDADEMSRAMNEALGVIAFFFTVTPALTLLPALTTAVVGEVARIRSLIYYVVAGGASAALMPLIAVHPQGAETYSSYAAPYFTLMATAGFAGGIVYWLVAGRNA
jgi:hypothetical protein